VRIFENYFSAAKTINRPNWRWVLLRERRGWELTINISLRKYADEPMIGACKTLLLRNSVRYFPSVLGIREIFPFFF
jgi:hypothetical protein